MTISSRLLFAAGLTALSMSIATAAPLTTAPAWTFTGSQAFSYLGTSVSSAGDVNGDGYADLVVGEPAYQASPNNYTGRVLVFLGSPFGLSVAPMATILGTGGSFGYAVAGAGDLNGDGYDDIIVGAPGLSSSVGAVFVYYGQPGGVATTPAWQFAGGEAFAQFGYSVSGAGDVNGDDFGDVIIGAPTFSDGGAVFVFHGSEAGLGMTYQWTAVGPEVDGDFGWSVSDAGDVNGDGYGDVIVGEPERDGTEKDAGAASVFLGSQQGLAASPVWTAMSDQDSPEFGDSVAGAGDVNGDGYDDVIVGAWKYDNVDADDEDHGAAFVYLGGPGGPSASASWHVTDGEEYSGLGSAVDGAGDVNGDGYDDVVISNDYPRARLHLGSAMGLSSTPDWTAQNAGQYGESVATAGDVNDDGLADVVIGNPYANFEQQGKAFVYHGVGSILSSLKAFDPNPWKGTGWPSLLVGDHVSTDVAFLSGVAARPVLGLAADGVTRILLQAAVSGPGTVEFSITDENGEDDHIGTLSTLGGSEDATILEVGVVAPEPGVNVAFAVLLAPTDFYRNSSDLGTRPLNVRAEYRQPASPGGPSRTLALAIVRPPVALLHGLWGSSGSWGKPGTGWLLKSDPRFSVVIQDYKSSNGDSFGTNIIRAKAAVNVAVRRLRDQGYAATQADVFGHSMGGLLFRLYAAGRRNDYVRDNNYGMGDIHKLVTVDTPHQGSELANVLDNIVDGITYNATIRYFVTRLLPRGGMCLTCGAIEDLRTNSVEISQLPAVSLPVHAMVGVGGVDALESANSSALPFDMAAIASILGTLNLGATLFEGDDHDIIVRKRSQLGGLGAASTQASVFPFDVFGGPGVHTSVTTELRFGYRAEALLNARVGDPEFASGFPAGPPPAPAPPSPRVPEGIPTVGLVITDPSPGTPVTPGTQIAVSVAPTGGFVPEKVLIASNFDSVLLEAPPFAALLDVPEDATGSLVIAALGLDATGAAAVAEEVELPIELSAELTGISLPADPLYLFSYAPVAHLSVLGDFDDGVQRDITSHDLGTTYESADPAMATVDGDGVVTAHDSGTTTITVSNGPFSADVTVEVLSAPLVLYPGPTDIHWPLSADTEAYDVVRGDLGTLRATGGDFAAATLECLGRTTETSLPFNAVPAQGQASWFLVRVVYGDARGLGSYESDGAPQPGARDTGIAASGNDCP